MANYNLSARKKKGYNSLDDRRSKLYNYIDALSPQKETEAPAAEPIAPKKKEADIFTRLLATGGDLLGNVVTGTVKGVEGIVDLGIGAAGAVGGIFNKDIRDSAQEYVEYDATHDLLGKYIDEITEDSFTNENEIGQIVEGVASGVGQMLPSVAITIISGGLGAPATVAQGLGLAATGVSAAGSAAEEAYKDGAKYYEGLGYGAVSGAVEAATEKLFGGLTGNITGKGLLDFGEEVAEQGIKRVVKGAVEEGAEEVISHAVNPLTKTIYKGKDALKEYADPEYYKEGAKAFITGAGAGMVYGGTVGKAINRAGGTNDDISAAVEANENIREKLIKAQDNGKLTVEAEREAAESRLKNLQSIEKKLQKADEKTRKTYIKNYQLDNTFNEDGTLKPEILAQENAKIEGRETVTASVEGENGTAEQLDRRYYSVGLRGKEQTVRDDLVAMSSEGEVIKPFTGELSENAQKNFTKMKKALTSLNKHRGESVSYVLVEANNKFNGAERRGDTIYIAADTLERDAGTSYLDEASKSGNFAGTMLHEYDHINEGTKAHSDLTSFLAEDRQLYASAVDRVLGQEYGITAEEIQQINEKQKAGGQLTKEEQQKLDTFYSEVGATMSEQLLGNERVIRKLVREGDPLVDRVISWFEDIKRTLAGKGDKFAISEKRRMDKALKLYEKAAEAAGKRDLVKRIIAMRDDEDNSAENEHLSTLTAENPQKKPLTNINHGNMHVSEGDFKYSIKYPTFTDKDIQHNIEELAEMKEVAIIDAAALDKTGKSPKAMFEEYFQSLGNSIYSSVYGDIAVGKSSVKSEIRHGITANKIASMSAIPEVIEKGKVIFFENKTSGDERVKRIVIAAPIKIQNDPYYMGVMLQRDPSTQYLYLHNVAIEKEMAESSRAHLVTTGADEHNEHLSMTSILQKAINVKLEKKKINGDTKFSRKTDRDRSTLTKGEAQKQKANYESDKVYTKAEISKMVESLSGLSSIPKKFRTEIVNDIWTAFNSRYSPSQREQHASFLANKIFAKVMQESGDTFDNTSQEDLYAMEREIHKALKKIAREGGSPSTRSKLEAEFNTSEAGYWKKQRDIALEKIKITGKLMDSASKMRSLKVGDFLKASNFKSDDLKGTVEQLARINFRGNLNVSGTRNLVKKLAEWYTKDNPMLKAQENGKNDSENLTFNCYDEYIAYLLNNIANGTTGFTNAELEDLNTVITYFNKFVESYKKVKKNGKLVDAQPLAKKEVERIEARQRIKLPLIDKFFKSKFAQLFLRPQTIVKRMDMHEHGFFTEALEELRQGLIKADNYEYEMMLSVEKFSKENPKYFEKLAKRHIEYKGRKMPVDVAMSLCMTTKRAQAQKGLALSGFRYEDGEIIDVDAEVKKADEVNIEAEMEAIRRAIYSQLSDQDKAFMKVVEKIFNGDCKQLKYDTDMEIRYYSNVLEDYYFPIYRAFIAKGVDSDYLDLIHAVENQSFNKATTEHSKSFLAIRPLTQVLSTHVKGVAQYAGLAVPIRNYDILYNIDTETKSNRPVSIASESPKVWKEGNAYFKELLSDMQGRSKRENPFLAGMRGAYATYQLGANPKTWVTQLSSIFAATSEISYGSIVKGFGVDKTDVYKYCDLAKLRAANNDAILAQANTNKPATIAQNKKLKKVSDVLMAPIGKVDEFVIKQLYGACQVEVESKGGAKVGTEENKIEAGKLLEKVIINTQQNALATEKSAAMRSSNTIEKGFQMFRSDAMNTLGQVIDGMGEEMVLKAKLRAATDPKEKTELLKQLKAARKRTAKAVGSLAGSSVYMVAIAFLFNALYHRIEDEDGDGETIDDIGMDALAGFIGNMIGGIPIISDAYSFLADGYATESYVFSMLNDLLESAGEVITFCESACTDDFDGRQAARTVRKVLYSSGQFLGIPVRNMYNITYSVLGFIPSVKYGIDNMFYEQAYSADLKKAVEAGDEDAIATITGIMTGERVGAIEDDKVREELNSLTLKGYSVLPKAIADTITVDGESVELTGTQKKQFKAIYSIANESVTELMALKQYQAAEEEIRAKAVKLIYDIYYQLAMDDVLGGSSTNKNALFAEAISVEKLAIIVATARSIEADKNKNGISISSSKKKKIEKYIQSLNITAAQKYMIMGYLGYKNTNGEASVKSYIGKLNLTKEEKAELLKYSGY